MTIEEVLKNVYYSHLSDEHFDGKVNEIYQEHEKLLVTILSGELLPKYEIDPLTGEQRDYTVDELREKFSESPKYDESS